MRRIFIFFILSFAIACVGCGPKIPKSESPAQIERVFDASFDRIWNAVEDVVKASKGIVITTDKASGLITYTVSDSESASQIFINVYIKERPAANTTTVYLFSKIKGQGSYLAANLKEVDKDFFEKLDKIIGRD
jgi:hypothetical protein